MRIPYHRIYPSPDFAKTFPDRPYISQPFIKVVLRYQNNKYRLAALIDSGADACLFPKDVADILGIDIERGRKAEFTSMGGNRIPFYFHEVDILLDRFQLKTKVGFAKSGIGASGLLGQKGFFEHFVISFDHHNGFIDLNKPSMIHNIASKLFS